MRYDLFTPGTWWFGHATATVAFAYFSGALIERPLAALLFAACTEIVSSYATGFGVDPAGAILAVAAALLGVARFGGSADGDTAAVGYRRPSLVQELKGMSLTMALHFVAAVCGGRLAVRVNLLGWPTGLFELAALFAAYAVLARGVLSASDLDVRLRALPIALLGSLGALATGVGVALVVPCHLGPSRTDLFAAIAILAAAVLFPAAYGWWTKPRRAPRSGSDRRRSSIVPPPLPFSAHFQGSRPTVEPKMEYIRYASATASNNAIKNF